MGREPGTDVRARKTWLPAVAALICILAAWLLLLRPERVAEYQLDTVSLPADWETAAAAGKVLWAAGPDGDVLLWAPEDGRLQRLRNGKWLEPEVMAAPTGSAFPPGRLYALSGGRILLASEHAAFLRLQGEALPAPPASTDEREWVRIRGVAEKEGALFALVEQIGRDVYRRDLVRWDADGPRRVARILQLSADGVTEDGAPAFLAGAAGDLLWLADPRPEGIVWFGYSDDGRLLRKWKVERPSQERRFRPLQATGAGLYAWAEGGSGQGPVIFRYDLEGRPVQRMTLTPGPPPEVTGRGDLVRLQVGDSGAWIERWRGGYAWRFRRGLFP